MSGVRADGATRGDLAEAASLVVAGGVLLALPILSILDRLGSVWTWLCVAGALGGAIIAGLGLRWFIVEGPPLVALNAKDEPALRRDAPIELPAGVRLVDARSRLRAHILRFVAIASGGLLILFDLGPLKWVILGLFFVSFVADQLLLRPVRWILDEEGLGRSTWVGSTRVLWKDVTSLYWRHYPDQLQPPFPTGERVIIEQEGEARDLEFVFHRRSPGTDGTLFVQALAPVVGNRLRVLRPRTAVRSDAPSFASVVAEQDGEL